MAWHIRWDKVALIALALAGIVSVIVARTPHGHLHHRIDERRPQPLPASNAERTDILQAAIGSPRPFPLGSLGASDEVVLFDSTMRRCDNPRSGHRLAPGCMCRSDRAAISGFAREHDIAGNLLDGLFAANQTAAKLPAPRNPAILLQPRARMESLYASANRVDRFHSPFPNARFAIETSRAVVSEDRAHAIIAVRFAFLPHDATCALYYLARSGDSWRVDAVDAPASIW